MKGQSKSTDTLIFLVKLYSLVSFLIIQRY